MRVVLGTYPTPVARLSQRLWVKRDDRSSEIYGGNKVRKLERLLGAARASGKTRLVTLGAAGSHQVVATALYGAALGFEVEAVLVPQPSSAHASQNLRVALARGLRASAAPAWALAPAVLASRWGRDAYFVPLGGSNALGTLGFVDAAHELAAQIHAGELDEPDVVVVATGSGGTAAGLAVAFAQAALKTRVIGVAVSAPAPVLGLMARRLARSTAALAGLPRTLGERAASRIEVVSDWIGRGYGYTTPEGDEATARAQTFGLTLDPTYTAKAFACALARTEETVLYWHTLSTASLDALDPGGDLPPRLARLLRR
ncbi:MAG: pyridoxal-phosphate dependent enzyme [Labilithrix sp.]|nr:pyridoxal-phosphate dependent enzyme [Labilithrix sp.]